MCICVYTHYVYVCVYIQGCAYVCEDACIRVMCVHACVCLQTLYTCVFICVYSCFNFTSLFMHFYIFMYISAYSHVHIYMFIYFRIYVHTWTKYTKHVHIHLENICVCTSTPMHMPIRANIYCTQVKKKRHFSTLVQTIQPTSTHCNTIENCCNTLPHTHMCVYYTQVQINLPS